MLKQNAAGLHADIQGVGCFFVSCLAIAQMKAKKLLSKDNYNELWEAAHKAGYMFNRNILASDKIINLAFKKLSVAKKAVEVGTDVGGFYAWTRALQNYQKIDACIEKIKQDISAREPFHFRVVNEAEDVLFDPFSPQIKSHGHVHTIWYRVLAL